MQPLRICSTTPAPGASSPVDDWLTLPRYDVVDLGLPSPHTTTPLFAGPGRHRRVRDVNARGDRVGSLDRGGQERATYCANGRVVDLGLLRPGDDSSRALALNDVAQVVGLSRCGQREQAFLWQGDHMIDLGGLCDPVDGSQPAPLAGSRARDINNRGQVVGRAVNDERTIGFVWSFLHGLLDLGSLLSETGWRIIDATHIDDNGRILATGVHNAHCYDLMLTPVRSDRVSARASARACALACARAFAPPVSEPTPTGWRACRDPARL